MPWAFISESEASSSAAPWRVALGGKGKGTGTGKGSTSKPWKEQTLAERYQSAISRSKKNTRVEWLCSACHATNFMDKSSCRMCNGKKGWLLVPKAPPPSGPATSISALVQQQQSPSPSQESTLISGSVPSPPGETKELADMSLSELKLEHQKVVSIRDSLVAAALPDAAKAVEARLQAIRLAMEQQKPTPQLLLEASAKVRRLAQAKAKAATKIEQLQQQLKAAEEEVKELQRSEEAARLGGDNHPTASWPFGARGPNAVEALPRHPCQVSRSVACEVRLCGCCACQTGATWSLAICPHRGECCYSRGSVLVRGGRRSWCAWIHCTHTGGDPNVRTSCPWTPSALWQTHDSANARNWAEAGEDGMSDSEPTS